MIRLLTFFLAALAMSVLLTPLCRHLAHRLGFVAIPKDDRWHKRPTALFGGVAIALTTLSIGVMVGPDARLWQLIGCGLAIAVVGFFDDIFSFKASSKLLVQVTLAAVLVFLGLRLEWTDSLVGDSMLTLFWIVGITNALNLLDNMDGLCAGITLIAGAFLLVGLYADPVGPAALYLAVLLGATAGFLVYNLHPASIFMGDTGSLFLGLNLATLTLIAQEGGTGTSGVWSVIAGPVLLLLVPIFDTTFVTVMRLLAGRRPSQGGRDHSSHRLVAIGLPEPTAVAVLWSLALFSGGLALSLQSESMDWTRILALTFFLAMVIFAVYLARIRVYDQTDLANVPTAAVTPLFGNFMYKRRVAEILLDLCLISIAYYSAYHLRFVDPNALVLNYQMFLRSLPIVLACQLVSLFAVGAYRGSWNSFGMMDAVVFAKGVGMGTVSAIMVLLFSFHFNDYSRAVFVVYAALLVLLLAGSRASFRLVGEFVDRRQSGGRRCVIYGTRGAGVATIREAFDPQPIKIVGFVDDDPMQMDGRVHGYAVLGDSRHLIEMIRAHQVDCVVVNTRIADDRRLQELDESCQVHGVDFVKIQLNLKPIHSASS
jgi:UDP-GlcNAc:undecaprenyl-phosphate GlcNAc-1-phosphate transferase